MREIHVDTIRDTVRELCKEAACVLPEDVVGALQTARKREQSPVAVKVLDQILLNADLARDEMLPLCQDTGTTVLFLDIGQDVHVTGGDLRQALSEGVDQGYREGFLRASIVERPFSARTNTKNNTPPIVHTEIVPGDQLRLQVMPKGGGCENMSRFTIMLPSAGKKGITEFVVKTVAESGGNPCPPIIVGLGVGGTAEHAMYMAKRALTRKARRAEPGCRRGRVRSGAAGRRQRARGRRPGRRRHPDGAWRAHEDAPDAHRLAARGGQPAVPLGAAEGSHAVMARAGRLKRP